MNKKTLSICIGTYNRIQYILDLLHVIENQLIQNDLFDDVEVIVSDNSTDNMCRERLADYVHDKHYILFRQNETNIGPINNLLQLAKLATGDYVWIFGDDDSMQLHTIHEIIPILKVEKGQIGLFHVLYANFRDSEEEYTPVDNFFNYKSGYIDNPIQLILSSTSHECRPLGRFLYLSSNIYKRDLLLQAIEESTPQLASPLYWSIYCMKRGLYLDTNQRVLHNIGDTTWSDSRISVELECVPQTVNEQKSSTLSTQEKKSLIFHYFYNSYTFLYYFRHNNWGKRKDACVYLSVVQQIRLTLHSWVVIGKKIYNRVSGKYKNRQNQHRITNFPEF